MHRFYLSLWISWVIRVVLCTLFIASSIAFVITSVIYIKQGLPDLSQEIVNALFDVWQFWFVISLNAALLIALFRSVKYLFNRPHAAYMMKLRSCPKEQESLYLEEIAYGNLVKVWRKWFMLLIWLVGSFMVIATIVSYIFSSSTALFSWLSIYILYFFILVAGYFSFIFLESRCKSVRIVKC